MVLTSPLVDYESVPISSRKLKLRARGSTSDSKFAEEDGIVTVAHVIGGDTPKVVICSGFAIGRTELGTGQTVVTCAHPLQSVSLAYFAAHCLANALLHAYRARCP